MKAYADLANLPEDDRISIAAAAAAEGHIVGLIVDDDAAADRYVTKLGAHPVRIVDRKPFTPVPPTVMIRIGPKES
jgi:hypothetical protein